VFAALLHELDDVQFVLLDLAVILVAAAGGGWLAHRLGQPRVVGEMIAGILLGPTLWGHGTLDLFPLEARPALTSLSTLGVVLFMFLVGLELRHEHLDGHRKRLAAGVAAAGTALPFVLGVLSALLLYESSAPRGVDRLAFCLFVGTALSITAFPVLARILVERGLHDRPLGAVVMAAAAFDDVASWITLALALAVISSSGLGSLAGTVALTALVALAARWVHGVLARWDPDRAFGPMALPLAAAAVLGSALVTHVIGLHEIFGAFIAGVVVPRGRFADELRRRLEPAAALLLPVFFVVTGLRVELGAVGADGVWQFALILAAACVGKVVGAGLGGRATGLGARESLAVGVLMNARGLTELVVLNMGLEAGAIDRDLFSLLVLMAIVTTVATGPLLGAIRPDPDLSELPALR
jgi:Kef-type K+ transport system membrane component KefB